ncbi:hypothetical protein STEG23_007821, partial [Scotinomys teguina]
MRARSGRAPGPRVVARRAETAGSQPGPAVSSSPIGASPGASAGAAAAAVGE